MGGDAFDEGESFLWRGSWIPQIWMVYEHWSLNRSKALPMKNLRREGTFAGHLGFRVACIKEQIVLDIAIVVVAKVIQAIQKLSSMRQQLIWRCLSPLINWEDRQVCALWKALWPWSWCLEWCASNNVHTSFSPIVKYECF